MASKRLKRRNGSTTVEMSLVLPAILLVFFGAIECSKAITIKETIRFAAYKGARAGAMPGTNASQVEQKAMNELEMLGVVGGQVTVEPAVLTSETENVTVTVSVPLGRNLITGNSWITNWSMSASCTLATEKVSLQ